MDDQLKPRKHLRNKRCNCKHFTAIIGTIIQNSSTTRDRILNDSIKCGHWLYHFNEILFCVSLWILLVRTTTVPNEYYLRPTLPENHNRTTFQDIITGLYTAAPPIPWDVELTSISNKIMLIRTIPLHSGRWVELFDASDQPLALIPSWMGEVHFCENSDPTCNSCLHLMWWLR